jgi:hypothetical protein
MPRVQVLADVAGHDPEVLLTEYVDPEVLSDDYYAGQLVERMGWALADAEEREETPAPAGSTVVYTDLSGSYGKGRS